jgi:hypothetical protein
MLKGEAVEITSMEAIGGKRGLSRPRFLVLAIALVAALALLGARDAEAAVTPGEAEAAAAAGAAWFANEQQANGALAGDWGMTALAAAGVNAADVRTSLVDPSAQDFYAGEWAAKGPGGVGTDFERVVLAGSAGGVQTSRVAANRNMVAQIAALWDGKQIGSTGLLNDDIFGVLALDRVEAPQPLLAEIADVIRAKQMPNGGWSWSNGPSAVAEADITGSVLGALCAAGADPQTDPAIQNALGYLHSVQDQTNGGFASPPFFPANTDSTGWVSSGLIACGIDPQSLEWTTSSGKTPFDYLLSMQLGDGRFCWKDAVTCDGSAAYATWDAVRPLAGEAWSAPAPPRDVASEPAVRVAPPVAAGTEVPLALVIDYGNGEVEMCRINIPSASDLGTALAVAENTATPSGCVTEGEVSSGSSGEALEQLNGVVPAAGSSWLVSVGGGPETATTSTPIGFGDMVSLRLDGPATEPIEPPPLQTGDSGSGSGEGQTPGPGQGQAPPPQPVAPLVRRANLGGADRARLAGNGVGARLSCPAGLGAEGCAGTVTIRYRQAGKQRTGGQAAFALAAGASRRVSVPLRPALRQQLGELGRRRVALIAATRAGDGSVAYSQSSVLLVAPRSPH